MRPLGTYKDGGTLAQVSRILEEARTKYGGITRQEKVQGEAIRQEKVNKQKKVQGFRQGLDQVIWCPCSAG